MFGEPYGLLAHSGLKPRVVFVAIWELSPFSLRSVWPVLCPQPPRQAIRHGGGKRTGTVDIDFSLRLRPGSPDSKNCSQI